MAIDFPNSPTLNQVFTSGGTSWQWNGTAWNLYDGANLVTTSYLSTALGSYAANTSPSISNPTLTGTSTIAAANVSGNLAVDTNVLYVNSSANSVGINYTASTSNETLVLGAVDASAEGGNLSLARSSDNSTYWHMDVYGSGSSPALRFHNDGTVKMSVDASGRVLKPNQPYFYAKGAESNYTLTNGADMPFNNAVSNVGSHFNTSTYRFTAPVSGKYLFTTSVFVVTVAGRLTIKVNNTSYNNLQMDVGAAWSQSAIINLNAGDYVSVGDWQSMSGGVFYMGHSHFSGMLLA